MLKIMWRISQVVFYQMPGFAQDEHTIKNKIFPTSIHTAHNCLKYSDGSYEWNMGETIVYMANSLIELGSGTVFPIRPSEFKMN